MVHWRRGAAAAAAAAATATTRATRATRATILCTGNDAQPFAVTQGHNTIEHYVAESTTGLARFETIPAGPTEPVGPAARTEPRGASHELTLFNTN